MLVQGTGWGAHTSVPALSHRQALHLIEAAFLAHALVVNSLYGLCEKQLKNYIFNIFETENLNIEFQQIGYSLVDGNTKFLTFF